MSTLRSALRTTLAAAICVSISSCSFFVKPKQAVLVRASDPDATLQADGLYFGKGAAYAYLTRGKTHIITAKTDTTSGAVVIDNRISVTGVLDIVGGCLWLVPFAGLLSEGAWTFDRDKVYIDMH